MSGDLNTRGPGGDEPGIDPRLRAALDHAPDGDLRPPPAVRAAVLAAAHGAHRLAAAPASGWRRGWAAVMAPRTLATAASVACVAIALKLAWPEPEWLAEPAGARPEAAAPALRHDEVGAEAARGAAPPATPEAKSAGLAEDSIADAPNAPNPPPAAAAPAPVPRARAPEARDVARDVDRRSLDRAPARAPAPAPAPITTITAAPPPAEAPAQPAPTPTIAAAPSAAPPAPRSEAYAPVEPRAAAKALSQDAQAQARRGLAAEVATSSLASPPAPPGHPAALARWAQALAAPADEGSGPPVGWQLRRGGEAVAWRPAHRAWWQALLAGTAGRWTLVPTPPPTGGVWQLRAPDGQSFSLQLEREQLWLQAEGGTWRAPRPEGLPASP